MKDCEAIARIVYREIQGKTERDAVRLIALAIAADRQWTVDAIQQELGQFRVVLDRFAANDLREYAGRDLMQFYLSLRQAAIAEGGMDGEH